MICSAPVTSPPSTTIRMCGPSPAGGALRENRGRSRSCSTSSSSIRASEPATIRTGPTPSTWLGCCTWGSHFAHSQSSFARPVVTTATSRSSGVWKVASCATIDRANPRDATGSPEIPIAAKPRTEMAIGSSGTMEWARTNWRSANVVIGSSSSTGPVCGATSRVASRCDPRQIRTVAKSRSLPRRSHIRRLLAIDHNAAGSGWLHSNAARCSCAASRARSRIWPR